MKATPTHVAVALVLCACVAARVCAVDYIVPPSTAEPAPYAEWAHHHWVWFSSEWPATQSALTGLVNDYLAYNISVGAVDVDSLWATCANNFQWDSEKYPDPQQFVDDMHALGVKVIVWTTSLVDTNCDTFEYGKDQGYFLEDGAVIHWWHGDGAFVDYTNPDGLEWWHNQLNESVLGIGIDGFKCDGTDPYLFEFGGIAKSYSGTVTEREYADSYYSDFFNYAREIRGFEALIMSRPVDDDWSFSPRDVVFSGWVGDDNPDWGGMRSGLWSMINSAFRNYVNFGTDIGGYRSNSSNPLGRTVDCFTRWYQLGAFCPLMENGGDGEHRPWMFDAPGSNTTVNNYRMFVDIHYELIPYLLTTGTEAYYGNTSAMHPLSLDEPFIPTTYDYTLGYDIFVAPMTDPGTSRDIDFPPDNHTAGANNTWVDWWNGTIYNAEDHVDDFQVPYTLFPVFYRGGSMIPLRVTNDRSNYGSPVSADALTLLITTPKGTETRTVREEPINPVSGGLSRDLAYTVDDHTGEFTLTVSAHPQRLVVIMTHTECPSAVRQETGSGGAVAFQRLKHAEADVRGYDGSVDGYACDRGLGGFPRVWLWVGNTDRGVKVSVMP